MKPATLVTLNMRELDREIKSEVVYGGVEAGN